MRIITCSLATHFRNVVQEEFYHKPITCQDVFSLKSDLISASYRNIKLTFYDLTYATERVSLAAYDLYTELQFILEQNQTKSIEATVCQLMRRTGFTRKNTFHKAKNELLETNLITSSTKKGYDTPCEYTVKFNPDWAESFIQVPWAIWNWLWRLLSHKKITRIQRHMYIFLYHTWIMSAAQPSFFYSPLSFRGDFGLKKTNCKESFSKLEALGLLARLNQTKGSKDVKASLFVESGLHYSARYQVAKILTSDSIILKLQDLKKRHGF